MEIVNRRYSLFTIPEMHSMFPAKVPANMEFDCADCLIFTVFICFAVKLEDLSRN